MAAALDDPFTIPDEPQPPARAPGAARIGSRVHIAQLGAGPMPSPASAPWSVIVDRQFVVCDFFKKEWAEAFAAMFDKLLPAGAGLPEALDEAVAAMVDLAGARELVASVLEHAALKQSADVSPAGALVDAARRVRGGDPASFGGVAPANFHGILVYENQRWRRTQAKGHWLGTGERRRLVDRWLMENTKATMTSSVNAILSRLRELALYPGCERCNKLACMLVCNVTKGTFALPETMKFRVLCAPCHVPGDGVIIAVV